MEKAESYMGDRVEASWLYYKLFLGRATDKTDQFIVNTISRARSQNDIRSWFYLRYYEAGEFQLRLRVKPVTSAFEKVGESVLALCTEGLGGVSELFPSDYRPMIYPTGLDPDREEYTGDVRIELSPYEPEFEKYGGLEGMSFAESHFMDSSELCISVLSDEAKGLYSRKTIAPLLMREVFRALVKQDVPGVFWSQYAKFWLGGDTPVAHDWRLRFLEKAGELDHAGIPVFAPVRDLPGEAVTLLNWWSERLAFTYGQYQSSGLFDRAPGNSLCSNFVHLMNNRLGLSVLEEAYLATLCEHAERQPVQ
jgi:thiopeptide-type bacteriocin biosynthesis protein